MNKTVATLLALTALSAPLFAGCSAESDTSGSATVTGEEANLTSADDALKGELTAALDGLTTGGGEGEPDAYRVFDFQLGENETLTNDVLLQRLLPRLMEDAYVDDTIPGLEEYDVAQAWSDNLEEPVASDYEGDPEGLQAAQQDVARWQAVKGVFDAKLTDVKYFDMGYRASPEGSLETGAVAHVFVGVTATGHVFAISGIDIWT